MVFLLALAAWVGGRYLLGGGRTGGKEPARVDRPREKSARMVFRDGRWVRLEGDELRAFLADLASRKPGLLRVSGMVSEYRSGAPVAGAEVVFAGDEGEWTAVSDDSGRYTVEVASGFYRAFARAEGYVAVGTAEMERLPGEPDANLIGVPRGELAPLIGVFRDHTDVDMQLRAGARVFGTVYDGAGRPVAGAVVTGRLAGYDSSRTHLVLGTDMAESDLDGSFHLEVPAGVIELAAVHADFAGLAERRVVLVRGGDDERVDLTLAAGCIISGYVVDSRGELVGDGSLEIATGVPPPNDFAPVGRIEAGQFRLARTDAGRVRMRAWPWKSPPSVPREFDCEDGTRYRDITFVVPDADPDLEGMVLGMNGEPLAGAFIDIYPLQPGGMAQQERADLYGEWAVFSLPHGDYALTAYVPGHGVASQLVTAPSRGVRLVLGGTGAISGTVTGMQDGSLTFTVERCVLSGEHGPTAVFGDFNMPRLTRLVPVVGGTFHIDDMPACTIAAVVKAKGQTRFVRVAVRAGQVASVSVDFQPPEEEQGWWVDHFPHHWEPVEAVEPADEDIAGGE